jgi:hypothetical protein
MGSVLGAITVFVGWIMIFTNGMASVPELLPAGFIAALENPGRQIDSAVPSSVWTALVGALFSGWWLRAAVRRTSGIPAHEASDPPGVKCDGARTKDFRKSVVAPSPECSADMLEHRIYVLGKAGVHVRN